LADAINIIPPTSLLVGARFTKELALATRVYLCTQTYTGANKDASTAQARCAPQEPLCSAQGPVPISPGGSIQFTFPLEDSMWTPAMLANTNQFVSTLYIDFMIGVFDAQGNKLLTTLQTTTPLRTTSIASVCTELQEDIGIEDIVSMDMFLGLVAEEALFAESLVQNLDITRPTPGSTQKMQRNISSVASNVMTLLVKGNETMFSQPSAQQYTLAVEDIITMHFLDNAKKDQVQHLITTGAAFTTQKQLDSAYR